VIHAHGQHQASEFPLAKPHAVIWDERLISKR
jgi:hypothetical protein